MVVVGGGAHDLATALTPRRCRRPPAPIAPARAIDTYIHNNTILLLPSSSSSLSLRGPWDRGKKGKGGTPKPTVPFPPKIPNMRPPASKTSRAAAKSCCCFPLIYTPSSTPLPPSPLSPSAFARSSVSCLFVFFISALPSPQRARWRGG
jgi:hypothetical protein